MKLTSVEKTPDAMPEFLEKCLIELSTLRDSFDLQTERKATLAARSQQALDAWKKSIEEIDDSTVRTSEENKLVSETLGYRQILRDADSELGKLSMATRVSQRY